MTEKKSKRTDGWAWRETEGREEEEKKEREQEDEKKANAEILKANCPPRRSSAWQSGGVNSSLDNPIGWPCRQCNCALSANAFAAPRLLSSPKRTHMRACMRACEHGCDLRRVMHPRATTACMRNASRVGARRYVRACVHARINVRARVWEHRGIVAKTGSRASDQSPALPLRGRRSLLSRYETTSLERPVALLQRGDGTTRGKRGWRAATRRRSREDGLFSRRATERRNAKEAKKRPDGRGRFWDVEQVLLVILKTVLN